MLELKKSPADPNLSELVGLGRDITLHHRHTLIFYNYFANITLGVFRACAIESENLALSLWDRMVSDAYFEYAHVHVYHLRVTSSLSLA